MSQQRRAVTMMGLMALAVSSAPSVLLAQRAPNPDTPRMLVGAFRSSDRALGAQVGDAVRDRVSRTPTRLLWVVEKQHINAYLESSGYRPDSGLSPNDLRELARLLRADEIVDGDVERVEGGVRVNARLILARDVNLVQPLVSDDFRDANTAAREVDRVLSQARRQLADNRRCENALRAQNYDEAISAANAAIRAYPQSTLGRLCLMTAYGMQRLGPDSVLRVVNEVLEIDPNSRMALVNAAEAYNQKGDKDRAIEMNLRLYRTDPSNTTLSQSIVSELAQSGAPERAIPILDELLSNNPGDPSVLRTRWLILLNAHQYAAAIRAGEDYVQNDTAAADANYFTRQIAAAASDSQPQLAAQFAARAVQKFPRNAELQMLYGQMLRQAGQLQQALTAYQAAVQADPAIENGFLFVIVTQSELGQVDSAFASAQRAVAAGADKETIGNALMAIVNPVVARAQQSGARADWREVLRLTQVVDEFAPTATTKFFIGVSSFQVGLDALQGLNDQRTNAARCAEIRVANEMWTIAQINMPGGAAIDRGTAGNILGAIQQYSPVIEEARKQFNCR